MLNIDGINIYTKTMITCDEDLIGQIYVGKEELKVRSIGHCAMLEEDAMHIGTEADVTGHVLDISGKKTQLRGLLDTGAVLSVIPIETWERMGFDKGDLIDSRIRLPAANKGALRVLGRTPIIALNLGERNLWMSFIVVENLDESDQFILGRDFIRNFDVTIDLNNAMFRIRNPDRRYAIKPVNLIMANENKAPVFLRRRVRLKANEAAIVGLRMKNYNELSDNKQVCVVPNPNSQSAAVLGRSFSITKSGLCVSVLLNTLDIPITIQRGRKLGYALPVKTRYETIENSKQNEVVDCPNHRDKICILRRLQKIKDSSGLIKSLKSETDDGLSSCSNFPERPTLDEMQNEKPVLPEIEHLRGKLRDEQLEAIKDVLERNEEVFSRHKADIGCCNFVEHEIELEENAVPHREGARRMTPHKSDACRKEIETLLEYDMIVVLGQGSWDKGLGTGSWDSGLGTVVLGQWSWDRVLGQWSWDSGLGIRVLGQGLGTRVLGQWSWDSGLGTVVLGQGSWDRVLGQWSWDSGLGTRVLGQGLGTVVLGQWSWDSGLGTGSWDSGLGTVVLGQGSWDRVLGQGSWDSGLGTVVLGQGSWDRVLGQGSWDSGLGTVVLGH